VGGWYQLGTTVLSIPSQLSDLGLLGFQGGLYFLADHDYRPAKVLWFVTVTLVGFWIWFLWPLNVVAYTSKMRSSIDDGPADLESSKIKPLGFVFLFDRMLPTYQIDSGHYEIAGYFKRIPISEIARRTSPLPIVRRLMFFQWPVERITNEREVDRVESSLRFLRLLGVVFAIFLAAAISALVIR
jgi:hypothetical protein